MKLSLAQLLASVPQRTIHEAPDAFRVQAIPSAPRHYIGRNAAGQPCLLLGSVDHRLQAPVRLAGIEAMFGVACRISPTDDQTRDEVLTVVTCTAVGTQVQDYFVHVCETIVRIVGTTPSQGVIAEVVQRLIDLFQRLTSPSSRSVVGLIGELYVIFRSRDASLATLAWRSRMDNRFDFSIEDVRLEVKASSDRRRAHFLSADQCRPPEGTAGILASLFIETTGGGMSVEELIRAIETRLAGNDDLVLKIQETVAETLGASLLAALAMRFDDKLARTSLQFYDLDAVPGIRYNIPPEVSQVRFRSDLSHTPILSTRSANHQSQILQHLLPVS